MAVRKRLLHDDATREKIQTSQLINRLQNNALGKLDLTQMQQRSIEILLRKTLPDLAATDLTTQGQSINSVRWQTEAEAQQSSRTTQGDSSETFTSDASDGLASWPTDGQAKQ